MKVEIIDCMIDGLIIKCPIIYILIDDKLADTLHRNKVNSELFNKLNEMCTFTTSECTLDDVIKKTGAIIDFDWSTVAFYAMSYLSEITMDQFKSLNIKLEDRIDVSKKLIHYSITDRNRP